MSLADRLRVPDRAVRAFRFAVVGVVNNGVGYGLFVIQSLLGVGHIEAMTASYALGMAISFWGNRAWTFGHDGPVWPTLIRFLVANGVGYGLNYLVLNGLVVGARLPQILAQLVATSVVAVCTFTLMRLWVFSTDTSAAEKT